MTSFDDAYRNARRKARKATPPPVPDPDEPWHALARRIDEEIIARFMRTKDTPQARACGQRHSTGFLGEKWYTWHHGSMTMVGVGFEIDSRGIWRVRAAYGTPHHEPSDVASFSKERGKSPTGRRCSKPVDEVFSDVQGTVVYFMTRHRIPLR